MFRGRRRPSSDYRIAAGHVFASRGQTLVSETPAGLRPVQFLPSTGGDAAVCLWEADSIESLSRYVDGTLGDSSRQDYFAIDEQHAMGLPVPA